MKRAKVEKPWYRTRNIVVVLLLVFVGWLSREVVWAYTVTPTMARTYAADVDALRKEAGRWDAEGENAFAMVLQAGEVLRDIEMDVAERWSARLGDPGLTDARFSAGFTWGQPTDLRFRGLPDAVGEAATETMTLAEQAGIGAFLDRIAATRRYERPPQDGPAVEFLLPDLGSVRSLARYCAADMAVSSFAGDAEGVARGLERGLALSDHLYYDGVTYIGRLVAIAIENLLITELRDILAEGDWDVETLERLLATLARYEDRPDVSLALHGERAMVLDTINMYYAADGRMILSEYLTFRDMWGSGGWGGGSAPRIVNVAAFVLPRYETTRANVDAIYDAVEAVSRLPQAERWNSPAAIEAERLATSDLSLQLLAPSYERIFDREEDNKFQLRLARTMLDIELGIRRDGVDPADLVSGVTLPGYTVMPGVDGTLYRIVVSLAAEVYDEIPDAEIVNQSQRPSFFKIEE